jgi:molybdopterin-guanine dinucleotide biosynthesis protein A
MGTNKALILYNGRRLIDWTIDKIKPLTNSMLISSNSPISNLSEKLIADTYKEIGPIGGLHACLAESETDWNLIIPCDMPNIDVSIYKELLKNRTGVLAVIPIHSNGKLEPLVGLYHKSIGSIVEAQIANGDYKLVNLLNKMAVCYIEVDAPEVFKNMNYPSDLV